MKIYKVWNDKWHKKKLLTVAVAEEEEKNTSEMYNHKKKKKWIGRRDMKGQSLCKNCGLFVKPQKENTTGRLIKMSKNCGSHNFQWVKSIK